MAYNYTVESYHINVGSGDGAIHIWTYGKVNPGPSDPNDPNGPKERRKVVRAIFMDGGRNDGSIKARKAKDSQPGSDKKLREAINRTIINIEQNYCCKNKHDGDDSRLRFDAFIITHWDIDHFSGVLRALGVFMRESQDGPHKFKIGNKVCLNRAYFDNMGNPESLFIAPYFTNRAPDTSYPGDDPGDNGTNQWRKAHLLDLRKNVTSKISGVLRAGADFTIGTTVKQSVDVHMPGANTNKWELRQLVLKTEWRKLLGRNFLQNDDQEDIVGSTDTILNLAGLLARNRPTVHDADLPTDEKPNLVPAMYCIAVNQRAMGNGPFGLMKHTYTNTNLSSICCMVVWKDVRTDNNDDPGHRSHYFAGDANIQLETRLLDWIAPGWNDDPVPGVPRAPIPQVSSMKLSHHGARSSNPVDMWIAFNPISIFVSAGRIRSHAHPRWELVAFAHLWNKIRDRAGCNNGRYHQHLLYLTSYPVWLVWENESYNLADNNTNEMAEEGPFADEWTKLINKYNEKFPNAPLGPADNFFQEWQDNINNVQDDETRADFICKRLSEALKDISAIDPMNSDLSESGVVQLLLDEESTVQHQEIIFVQVSSTGNATTEGVTWVSMAGIMKGKCNWELELFKRHIPDENLEEEPKKERPLRGLKAKIKAKYDWVASKRRRGNPDDQEMQIFKFWERSSKDVKSIYPAEIDDNWDLVSLDDFSDDDGSVIASESDLGTSYSITLLDGPHYLIPETWQGLDQADVPVVRIPKAHPMFNFMEGVAFRALVIQRKPVGKENTPLAENDPTAAWFAAVLGDETRQLSISFESWPPPGAKIRVPGRDITLDATTLPVFSFDFMIAGKHKITMDTTSAESVLDDITTPLLQNMMVDNSILIFGLNPVCPSFDIPLSEVAKYFGFSMDKFFVMKILGKMTLKLDTEVQGAKERKRNALWFRPAESWETVLRLQFRAETPLINDLLQRHIGDFKISNARMIGKKIAHRSKRVGKEFAKCEGRLTFLLDFELDTLKLEATIEVSETSVLLRLRNNKSLVNGVSQILSWLGKKLGENTLNLNELLKSAGEILNTETIAFRGLDIVLGVNQEGNLTGIDTINLSFQVLVNIGGYENDKEKVPIVFLFEFSWSKLYGPSLRGALWPGTPDIGIGHYVKAAPGWERHTRFEPITNSSRIAGTLNLKSLLSSSTIENIPNGIPTDITQLSLLITKSGLRVEGVIQCEKKDNKGDRKVPALSLDQVALVAEYNWDPANRGLTIDLGVDLLLDPPNANSAGDKLEDLAVARLSGSVFYDSATKSWSLGASLEDLTVAHLASFWTERSRTGAMAFLERIKINYLELQYSYDPSSGDPSYFLFEGHLSLGLLNFDLEYENKGSEWTFTANLSAGDRNSDLGVTVEDILKSILGESPSELPDPVASIKLDPPKPGNEFFRFKCFEMEDHVVFLLTVKVSKISLSFMQIRHVSWDKLVKSKRIIKAAITDIPTIDVGIVSKLPQPFDQLFFLWTNDGGQDELAKETKTRGLLKKEMDVINSIKNPADSEKLFFKPNKKISEYKDEDVVITAGSHIFVVMKTPVGDSNVLLDYAFKKPKPKPNALATRDEVSIWEAESSGNKGSKAPLKKTIGPLSIENIGLTYKDEQLGVMFDATFLMGPIGLSLLGFGVQVPFNKTYNLKNPPPLDKVGFSLEGMIVSFERPPLTVAGGFKRSVMDGVECYAGGLIIKFDPWQFQAAGVYATVPRHRKTKAITAGGVNQDVMIQDSSDKFTMVFIYFKLNGPLFTVGFADISGLTGGFGVNSDINTPTVEQVVSFPFVKPTGKASDSPLAIISGLMDGSWFSPSEGKFWVAAGLKVSAFQMLNVDAVMVLKFNPSVKIGIFGVATCDVPSSKSPVKFAYVELGISCCLDVEAGTFKLEAQLSPNSFVLHPSCHLTGGFALFSWFKDGPDAVSGDWVMTIGGYHQAFVAPRQYPKPPRLRISWSLDDHLSVSGEAYFAITPKICMGGGRLHAALSLGALYAYFDAYVDFLINYKPFHFQAQGGISVGVRFTLDLWLVTIRIAVEIGATLKLAGPPMGGVVHVDFWVFGFDIEFGASPEPAPKLSLEEFWQTALKDSKSTAPKMITSGLEKDVEEEAEGVEKAFLITCESGLEPEYKKETKENDPWFVRPDNFAFNTTLKFAANDITFTKSFKVDENPSLSTTTSQKVVVDEKYKNIYARPMEVARSLKSELTVTVYQYSKDVCALRNTDPGDLLAFIIKERYWEVKPIIKSVPQSIWGKYDTRTDPKASGNRSSALLNGNDVSIPLVMGLSIKPPEPEMSDDKIQKFNIVKDMKQSVYTDHTVVDFPKGIPASKNWAPLPTKLKTEEVVAIWENGSNDPINVVNLWAAKMKYPEGVKITGARPSKLLKKYAQMVPAMPLLAVGS
ncbi:hypothetical protein TWF730_010037 [Orbilia blumenaviensis]|uniref:DUF6603 domain-containing protein n=1 Tax=Orbilia blumenaviensis TaxID=1796055 RepID=A0AAV9UTM0_9PEZI